MAKKRTASKSVKAPKKGKSRVSGRTVGKASRHGASKPKVVKGKRGSAVAKPLKKTPLSKSELAEFRAMLLAKRRALLGDMSGIEAGALRTNRQEGSGDLSNMPTHPADIGSDNFEQEFTLGLLESERAMLKEINEALDRIDNGTYGICPGTGQFVGKARLKARPWAKYCIEYARLLEKGLVKPGDDQAGFDSAGDDDDDEDDIDRDEAEVSEAAEEEEEPAEEDFEE